MLSWKNCCQWDPWVTLKTVATANGSGVEAFTCLPGTLPSSIDYACLSWSTKHTDVYIETALHWGSPETGIVKLACRSKSVQKSRLGRPIRKVEDLLDLLPYMYFTSACHTFQLSENPWLACREEYFGLRIRHRAIHSRAINIPVNSTVGPSGMTLTP